MHNLRYSQNKSAIVHYERKYSVTVSGNFFVSKFITANVNCLSICEVRIFNSKEFPFVIYVAFSRSPGAYS